MEDMIPWAAGREWEEVTGTEDLSFKEDDERPAREQDDTGTKQRHIHVAEYKEMVGDD